MLTATKILACMAAAQVTRAENVAEKIGLSLDLVQHAFTAGHKLGVYLRTGRQGEWFLNRAWIERPAVPEGTGNYSLVLLGTYASIGPTQACADELQERMGVAPRLISVALANLREAGLIKRGARVAGLQFYRRVL